MKVKLPLEPNVGFRYSSVVMAESVLPRTVSTLYSWKVNSFAIDILRLVACSLFITNTEKLNPTYPHRSVW